MVGNKWFKTDLHVHSPKSICFTDKTVTAEEWVKECLDKGLDCVALTDHNSGEAVDQYKKEAERQGLILFPGIEVTCGETGTHLLIIFELNDSSTIINDFLVKLDIDRDTFGKSKPGTGKTVEEVIKIAADAGKVVIPAHIDEFNGLGYLDNTIQDKILNNVNINGVQVVQKEFLGENVIKKDDRVAVFNSINQRYGGDIPDGEIDKWYKVAKKVYKTNLSCLTFSDNPHKLGDSKHGLWGIGRRYTYIKMSDTPSLKSLKDALRLSEQRIRNDFHSEFSPEISKNIYLKKLYIKNTTQSEEEVVIDFSSDLSTIIGGRGTGKSFITRLLAFVLRKEDTIKQFPEVNNDYFNFIKECNNGSGVLKKESIIELDIFFNGIDYRIIRTLEDSKVYSKNAYGTLVDEPYQRLVQISDSVDIYLQKQIFEMTKNSNSIREFLDRYCTDELSVIIDNIQSIEEEIKKISLEIEQDKARSAKQEKVELDVKDLEEKIKKLSNPKYQSIVSKKEQNSRDHAKVKQDLLAIESIIQENDQHISKEFVDKSPIESEEICDLRKNLVTELNTLQKDIQKILTKQSGAITKYKNSLNKSNWIVEINKSNLEYQQLDSTLSTEELSQLRNISQLKLDLSNKQTEQYKINGHIEKIISNKKEIEKLFESLDSEYKKLCETRRTFVKDTFHDSSVSVNVQEQGDFDEYILKFRSFLGKDESFGDEFATLKMELERHKISTKELYEDILKIIEVNESSIFHNKRLINSISAISSNNLLEIRLLKPKDKIIIKISVNGRNVELTNASAGQKTSAILTLILSLGTSPLIMDQPEDDLDSQLINNLIVQGMLENKLSRQMVVVTHNPNIPVNGDSDWVIAMGDTSKLSVGELGSIDDKSIKNKICAVMEGGASAFEKRAIRYGFQNLSIKEDE